MSAVLELEGVVKFFGNTEIIRGVDLAITEGERHAIIGPNGAGKSTIYNLITGKYPVTAGTIRLRGHEITGRSPFEVNRMGLARSFQVTNIFPRMTVFENVRCGMLYSSGLRYSFLHLVNRDRELNARAEHVLEQIGMADKAAVPAALLSYADQRALELGITIAGGAAVVLLDEPTAGMSHSETDQAVELIRALSANKTIVIVEHDMGVVFNLADRISVLVYGEIIATDVPDRIRGNPAVIEAYLGTEATENA